MGEIRHDERARRATGLTALEITVQWSGNHRAEALDALLLRLPHSLMGQAISRPRTAEATSGAARCGFAGRLSTPQRTTRWPFRKYMDGGRSGLRSFDRQCGSCGKRPALGHIRMMAGAAMPLAGLREARPIADSLRQGPNRHPARVQRGAFRPFVATPCCGIRRHSSSRAFLSPYGGSRAFLRPWTHKSCAGRQRTTSAWRRW